MQKILETVREVSPHVVHIQYHNEDYDAVEMISALPLCLKETLPETLVVTTLHNVRSVTFAPRLTMGVFLRFADWLVLTNDADREVLLREHPLHSTSTRWCRRPAGCRARPACWRHAGAPGPRAARAGLADDVFLLGYFGFINEEKGIESLLEALRRLRDARFPAHLLLVGGLHSDREAEVSPYREELVRMIRALGLREAVTATGYLDADAASKHLVALDLAVLPFRDGVTTKRSSFLSILSHDVPVLATRGPHLPPALRHGETCTSCRWATWRRRARRSRTPYATWQGMPPGATEFAPAGAGSSTTSSPGGPSSAPTRKSTTAAAARSGPSKRGR